MRYILSLLILLLPGFCFAALTYKPLEITNIKPSGTGDPAILSDARIFRAYPGIEYNIRAAVIGGVYPYEHTLTNAPSGMTVNATTGEIVWPNPTTSAANIMLTVVDSVGNSASAIWSINVSTDGFVFIDSSYSGTQTGSIAQPFSSISSFASGIGSGHTSDIVYFREGNYTLLEYGEEPGRFGINALPAKWLGYPGETVTIDANEITIRGYGYTMYFDNLEMHNFVNHGFIISPSNYHTFRRLTLRDLVSDDPVNQNQGFIYTTDGGVPGGYGLVFQDIAVTNSTGAEGIGSIYSTYKMLIENCQFDNGHAGLHSFTSPIGLKLKSSYYTIRGNKIILPTDAGLFEVYNKDVINEENYGEICWNFIKAESGGTDRSLTFFYPKYVNLYRNTFVGDITFYTQFSNGPFYFYNNVLLGSLVNTDQVESGENIVVSYGATDVINADGELLSAYADYVGVTGWQFVGGTTPIEAGSFTPNNPEAPITSGPILRTGSHLLRVGDGVLRVQ